MEEIETKEDVNERFPSGYYLYTENGKDKLISGIDHTIRELNGKELTKIPSIIICTKNKNGTSYVSNRDSPVTVFESIKSHYKKVIDKKDYSYDFSKFYYIEDETISGNIPTKLLLHKKDEYYDGYEYDNGKLIKKTNGNFDKTKVDNQIKQFKKINKISFDEFKKGNTKFYLKVNSDNNTLSFSQENGSSSDTKIYTLLKVETYSQPSSFCYICFSFNNLVIENDVKFSVKNPESINNSIDVEATFSYHKPIKEINTITSEENCQYGIYKIKENNGYSINKYIALKFDEFAALPNYIKNFYTKEATNKDVNDIACLLKIPGKDNSESNIVPSTETITEVYVIKHY